MLVILMVCSYILLDPSCANKVPMSDLFTDWKYSFTNLRYFLTLFIYGMIVFMLFAMIIRINIRLNMLDHFHTLSLNFSSLVLSMVMICFSSKSDKSRSNTPKWKLTYSLHSDKFKPLNIVTDEACEYNEITVNKS